MKPKRWSVNYNYNTSYEADVWAHSKEEAINKVKEVVGDDIKIEHVTVINDKQPIMDGDE